MEKTEMPFSSYKMSMMTLTMMVQLYSITSVWALTQSNPNITQTLWRECKGDDKCFDLPPERPDFPRISLNTIRVLVVLSSLFYVLSFVSHVAYPSLRPITSHMMIYGGICGYIACLTYYYQYHEFASSKTIKPQLSSGYYSCLFASSIALFA